MRFPGIARRRDHDRIFGTDFTKQVEEFGIQKVLGAPGVPQQRAYIERLIGTIRRECLDHVMVFNEASLSRHLKLFLEYYHQSRTHLSLEKDTPESRSVQSAESTQAHFAVNKSDKMLHPIQERLNLELNS